MEWRLEERATGMEDKKEAGLCREYLGRGKRWKWRRRCREERTGCGNGNDERGRDKEIDRERKRGRARQGGELLESAVECRRREEDRRKQAAIVSDDSLVATHVILPRPHQPPPFDVSLFRSFHAADSRRVPHLVSLTDRLTKSLPTPLPHCDNLIARSETTVRYIFRLPSSSVPRLFVLRFPRYPGPILPANHPANQPPIHPRLFSRRNRCTCVQPLRHY